MTSARDDRHLLLTVVNGRTASSRQLSERLSTAEGILMSASSIGRRLLHHGLRARSLYTGYPSRQTTDGYDCNGLMSTEPDKLNKLIGTKLPFQMNHTSVCGTMMDAFVVDAMPPAYSPDKSPIEQVWDLVGRRLARVPRPAVSKDELLLRMQAIWNSLPQADIQNLFDFMPRRIAALIAARIGYTKY
ncbi:transposable element Tcb2 transposase [Trichonephila clavipes]|nr:transposable element Tcb2 transposase [Trichonephila clavipes]